MTTCSVLVLDISCSIRNAKSAQINSISPSKTKDQIYFALTYPTFFSAPFQWIDVGFLQICENSSPAKAKYGRVQIIVYMRFMIGKTIFPARVARPNGCKSLKIKPVHIGFSLSNLDMLSTCLQPFIPKSWKYWKCIFSLKMQKITTSRLHWISSPRTMRASPTSFNYCW